MFLFRVERDNNLGGSMTVYSTSKIAQVITDHRTGAEFTWLQCVICNRGFGASLDFLGGCA